MKLKASWTDYQGPMDLFATEATHSEIQRHGFLTDEHASCSYGQPALIDAAGNLYDPLPSREIYVAAGSPAADDKLDFLALAQDAGHRARNYGF